MQSPLPLRHVNATYKDLLENLAPARRGSPAALVQRALVQDFIDRYTAASAREHAFAKRRHRTSCAARWCV